MDAFERDEVETLLVDTPQLYSHQSQPSVTLSFGRHNSTTEFELVDNGSSRPTPSDDERTKPSVLAFFFSSVLKAIQRHAASQWKAMKTLYGWRVGVMTGLCVAFIVLAANVGLLVHGAISGFSGGVAHLIRGDSAKVTRYNTAYHTLINVMSTLLLGASNYTMQVLNSLTREEVDLAHAKETWVEIGVVSLRNLRFMNQKRRILWWILGISSVPLHLFYNAAIFPVHSASEFHTSFIQYEAQARKDLEIAANSTAAREGIMGTLQNTTTWSNTHRSNYSSSSGDLFLIYDQVAFSTDPARTTAATFNGSITLSDPEFWESMNMSFFWYSSNWSGLGRARSDWLPLTSVSLPGPASLHIVHAYTVKSETDTSLDISLLFMLIVIVFNVMKIFAMYSAFYVCGDDHFITIGDAVASYLRRPEAYSKNYCTLSQKDLLFTLGLRELTIVEREEMEANGNLERPFGLWRSSKKRLISSLSSNRGATTLCLFTFIIVAIILLLTFAIGGGGDLNGWGSKSEQIVAFSRTSFTTTGTLTNALLANIPQLLLSVSYFFFNGVCTAMATAQEWNSFGTQRKALRVSKPAGAQRDTYFLQLPYKLSIPLAVMSGLMHWLLSQSFFLVRQDYRNGDGTLQTDLSRSACGISALSLLVLLVVYLGLYIFFIVFAFIRIRVRIPFAASCSLVYSAACHPPESDLDAQLKPVQWGMVGQSEHCTITSQAVTAPIPGVVYR